MDVFVAPRLGLKTIGGAFRRPLPEVDQGMLRRLETGLAAAFEVEDKL
jgi:hypothetical protein